MAVWRFMIEQHGTVSSVITGSSTHNERIERLWRDVYRCVASIFYDIFSSLEDEGKLNAGNEIDLYCLHFIFLPRINSALHSFIESWNNHPISTENNKTPNQLFIRGALEQNIAFQYPQPSRASISHPSLPAASAPVEVLRSRFTPCAAVIALLTQNIIPLAQSDDFGYTLYCQTVDIVGGHLQAGCHHCVISL